MQEIKLVLQEKTFFLIKTMMVTTYAMPVVSEDSTGQDLPLLPPNHLSLSNLNFQTQKKHHQNLTEKLLSLIKQCKSKNLLKQIHTQMPINSIPKPNFLLSKIVDLKDLAYASLVFNQLTKPNIYAFNFMLRGLATTWKKYDFCVELYYKLKSLGLKANNFTYPFLFIA
jgi:hypothetical protein